MNKGNLSANTLRRLPFYLHYLRTLSEDMKQVSATQIAEAVGFGDVQVRKDLAAVSDGGRPRIGYDAKRLLADIQHRLSADTPMRFCIVGAGHMGMALAQYPYFTEYGLYLAAVFDVLPQRIGAMAGPVPVQPVAELEETCRGKDIAVGVITVPPQQAQTVCDMLSRAGVKALWNFAPIHLAAPKDVFVEHENMAAHLGILSRHLERMVRHTGTTWQEDAGGRNR